MKKTISIVFIAILASCMLFAAGASEKKDEDKPVTITYAFWGNPEAIGVEAEIIAAFEAKYPNIKVEPVVSAYGDYHTKLLTMIAGGSTPDVMRISTQYLPDLAASGGLSDINNLAQKYAFDMGIYYEQGIMDCSYNNVVYGLPWGTAPIYMLMNIDMFEAAGIELPSYDWTLDDFQRIVRQISAGEGTDRKYGFAIEISGDLYPVYPYVWANGGDLFDSEKETFTFNQKPAYEAIQMLADLYAEGHMPKETIMAGAQTISVPTWFINDKVAMFQGTAANVLSIQQSGKRFEVWPLPSAKGVATTVIKSNATAVSSSSKHEEAAFLFASFARGPEGESIYMKAKRVPPSIKGDEYWNLYLDAGMYPSNIKEVTNLVFEKYGRLAPVRKGYLEIEQNLTSLVQNVMLGNTTAEKAMTDITPRINTILSNTK